jgi:hypothetical protein
VARKYEEHLMMIKWNKIEAGEYKSEDNRFHIIKTWNRIYGNHWQLYDSNNKDYYKGLYQEKTLLDCKLKAEVLVNKTNQ